ncbi:DNA-binding transcriptional MerR regulator [Pseudomonas nitritireducens]|uniref:DNA-binding transcriptional MerR regulator n=1 Tax=Pseudomonas nitroreducens TaxID=46680 RepID=A0A7W7P0T8_PSENT|nr:MerR family transcriptional regulator [Pseudomonas nitritireducens]MBB4864173.1 DNA-binding transcriptional MerR regulator [Pseudomonas nitritireducens]
MYIGKVAELSGVTVKGIRHYEAIGLLPPPRREGKYRVYGRETVELLVVIKCAQQLGFKLREMQELLQRDDGLAPWDRVRQAIAAKKRELRSSIRELQRNYRELEAFESSLQDAHGSCELGRLPTAG